MEGGSTRYCLGTSASPSYCNIPAKNTEGARRPDGPVRSNSENSGPSSNAREISMARSPRKLNSSTASPSATRPTGAPAPSTTTNGSRYWSPFSLSPYIVVTASVALANGRPTPCTWHW